MKKYYIAFVLLCSINYNCVSSQQKTVLPTTIIQAEGSGGYRLYSIQEIASNQENNLTEDNAVQLYNKICSSDVQQLALLFGAKTISQDMVDTLKSEAQRQLNDYFAVREKPIQPGQSCNTSFHQEHPLIQVPDTNLITDTDEEYNAFDRQPWITKLALGMPWIQTIFAGTIACAAATAIYNQADSKITQPLIGATALLTTSALIDHYDAYQARLRLQDEEIAYKDMPDLETDPNSTYYEDEEQTEEEKKEQTRLQINDFARKMLIHNQSSEKKPTNQTIVPVRYSSLSSDNIQPNISTISHNIQLTDNRMLAQDSTMSASELCCIRKMSQTYNPRNMNMKAIFRR